MALPEWLSMIFPVLGILLSWALYLSSSFAINEMIKTQILHVNPYPYPILFLNAVIWGCFAIIKKDLYIFWANAVGVLLMLIFMMIVFSLADQRTQKRIGLILIGLGSLIVVVVFLCHFWLSPELAVVVSGICGNLVTCLTFVFPLVVMFSVVRKRDSSVIDPRLASVQFLNALVWMSYGLAMKSPIIYASNVFGSCLGLVQLLLWVMFRKETDPALIMNEFATV